MISETGDRRSEDARTPELVSAVDLIAKRMAQKGEYLKQMLGHPSSLQKLVLEGGDARKLLSLQPSVLGNLQRNEAGEEVVVWGGEGSQVADVLTQEQLGPKVNQLLQRALEDARGGEAWVPFALKNQQRWRIPAGESMIVVNAHFDDAREELVADYAYVETPISQYLPLADAILDSVREEMQGANSTLGEQPGGANMTAPAEESDGTTADAS